MKLLKEVDASERKACFRSVFAYGEPEKEPVFFIGECHGRISTNELGDHGFGYDPIFIPDGDTRTFGQMDTQEKTVFHIGANLWEN